ncbi:MAG TPA: hypothetical protein VHF69_11660 [Candidatus Synoicihabitans sp.]|nr:hypothetical protein [Candidatus Synoicihabitans sp.]
MSIISELLKQEMINRAPTPEERKKLRGIPDDNWGDALIWIEEREPSLLSPAGIRFAAESRVERKRLLGY